MIENMAILHEEFLLFPTDEEEREREIETGHGPTFDPRVWFLSDRYLE